MDDPDDPVEEQGLALTAFEAIQLADLAIDNTEEAKTLVPTYVPLSLTLFLYDAPFAFDARHLPVAVSLLSFFVLILCFCTPFAAPL